MKFEEVLPALKEGKKIGRKKWNKGYYYETTYKYGNNVIVDNYGKAKEDWEDILATDWEIVEKKKKVKLRDLTWEQYIKWVDNNCLEYNNYCDTCPFQKVKCEKDGGQNSLWINNKDLYSDKFLDQEIEIEED